MNFYGLFLRALSMLGKFLLVMLLSKRGSLDELGIYGLFLSSIALLNYFQGLEFNRFTAREISTQSPVNASKMVASQIFVHLFTYLFVLPLSLLIFTGGFLSWSFVVYFLWIAVFTHLGQEISRLLIIFSRTSEAYIVSFLIHGLWACIAVITYFVAPEHGSLDTIFLLWSATSLMGVILGSLYLLRTARFGRPDSWVDKEWIANGLQVSYKFFVGIVAFKIIELSDRFFIQYYHGESLVGVYTFYGSVANIVQEFVYTGAIVILIPGLLLSYKERDFKKYNESLGKLKTSVWKYSSIITVLVLLLMFVLLGYIDRDLLSENYPSFILLVFSSFILNVSLIPHYKLYMAEQDSSLMWSAVIGVILNLLLNFFFIPSFGALGAASATIISFSLVLACKIWFARRLLVVAPS